MSIAELRESIAAGVANQDPGYNQRFMIQQKFAIPAASLVLALIGLALGISHRKDSRFSSFVLGFAVIFAYYVVLWTARAGALSGRVPASFAPWIPNLVFGIAGVALLFWRAGSADQPVRINIPAFWRRGNEASPAGPRTGATGARPGRVLIVIRVPHFDFPRPGLLDLCVSSQYLRIFFSRSFAARHLLHSTFMDLADRAVSWRRNDRDDAPLSGVSDAAIYYIIPVSVPWRRWSRSG